MGAERTSRAGGRGLVSIIGWWLAVLAFLDGPAAIAFPVVEEIIGPQGFARGWEAGMPVANYSQVNLHTGRVVTALPITGWSGRSPSVGFSLYHNMTSEWSPMLPPIEPQFAMGSPGDGNGDGTVSEADIEPFIDILLELTPSEADLAVADLDDSQSVDEEDLGSFIETLVVLSAGPEWTHSYSAQLFLTYYTSGPNNGTIKSVTLTRDDGTRDVFTRSGANYLPPPGVFDKLTADATGGGFTLTSKSQWKAHFFNTLRRFRKHAAVGVDRGRVGPALHAYVYAGTGKQGNL